MNTSVYGQGGGIYCSESNSVITGNTISGNVVSPSSVTGYGGGIYTTSGDLTISNNTVSANTASINGAGIYCNSGSPDISNNIISGNTTPGTGGGIYCAQGSTPTVLANEIAANSANRGGGIACAGNNNMVITDNTISNNTAVFSQGNDGAGGGIYFFESSPEMANNTITNNSVLSSTGYGGGIYCNNSSFALANGTIANNTSTHGGALYCTNNSDPWFENTIFWNNFGSTAGNTLYAEDEPSDPDFNYCDVQYGSSGLEFNGNFHTGSYQNNISSNPLFVAPSGGNGSSYDGVTADWSLQSGSPCINTGNPNGSYVATDKAGNPRVVNTVIDMGAYESQIITGINETSAASGIIVFPNPASRSMVISLPIAIGRSSVNEKADLRIFNASGQQVFVRKISGSTTTLDVSGFAAGVYFVRAETGSGRSDVVRINIVK